MARKDPSTKKAKKKYAKEKTKNKSLQFSPKDMHLCEHAEATGNFSGYVKGLIRSDMERTKE